MMDRQLARGSSSPKDIMLNWFHANFEDPVHSCPWVDGEYVFIHGGPYDAHDMLESKFGGVFDSDEIIELADELYGVSREWAPVNNTGLTNRELATLTSVDNHSAIFKKAIIDIEDMANLDIRDDLSSKFYGMLFVNIITTLETYLFDRFLTMVMNDDMLFRGFVESSPRFKKQKFSISEIHTVYEGLRQLSKEQISEITWHNLRVVKNLYRQTMDVDMGDLEVLLGFVNIRHDLVHRNGRKDDETFRELILDDVLRCANAVKALVEDMEDQMLNNGFFGPPDE